MMSVEWPSYFQASIWLFENVPGSLDTLGAKTSLHIVYKTMFLLKIQKNIYIMPIRASTVINQIVNKVRNALKQPHPMNPIFCIWRKSVTSNPGKTRQGMTRHGKARPGEPRRGKTRRRPDKKVSPGFEKLSPVNTNYDRIVHEMDAKVELGFPKS